MRNAFTVSVLISLLCPIIGMFLVLRRYSMIGDTLAHSSLAGVAGGLLLNINPILSAFVLTSMFGVLIEFLRSNFRRYAELVLVVVLTLSVGTAITIISSGAVHADIESFLFGSVLTVTKNDVATVGALTLVSAVTVAFMYSRLVFITFDETGAQAAGVSCKAVNYVFSVLVAATVSIAIRIVGILVISSLIALPVATAMLFGKGFKTTLAWSVVIGFIDVTAGIVISYAVDAAPGGITALISVFMLAAVMIFKKILR